MTEDAEHTVWKTIDPDDIWVLDKLILSRKLNYNSGPVGLDVPHPGHYIVRPCVNMQGLGLGAQRVYIEKNTDHLPVGHFWCEWFSGRHFSIDYYNGTQMLCVEGKKPEDTFTKWQDWKRQDVQIPYPEILNTFVNKHPWVNCEFIGSKLIEVHLRRNQNFDGNISHFVPVWQGESTVPPTGYTYREYPGMHGRIGAFVK